MRRTGIAILAFVGVLASAYHTAGEARGDAARGREVFAAKRCARCHQPGSETSVGPPLEKLRRPQGAYELAGRLWNHAPGMFTVLTSEKIEWPRFTADEMADLMAYLQADPARDPVADVGRGQVTLVKKACLKCHTFNGEGGNVGPELTKRREDMAPASRWAATMWSHTPRMAAASVKRGVLYPRFDDDELVNLLGFLLRDEAR